MTQDTEQQIGSEQENTLPFVYMHDNDGNKWLEKNYEGYGEFGGKDYYELLDQMNGGTGDRSEGIRKAFDPTLKGKVLFPALTVSPNLPSSHDFTKEAEHDPNQSWYAGEEDEDDSMFDDDDNYDYGGGFGDRDTPENYDEEELDENINEAVMDVATVAQAVADAFTADDPLDIKYVITPGSVEGDLNGGGFDLDAVAGPNTPGEDWEDENGFGIDYYLGKYAGGSFVIKNEGDVSVVKNAAMRNAIIAYVTPEGEIDMVFDVENHYNTMSDKLTGMKEAEEAKKPNKMKKSQLKELIKSSIMNEIALDIDKMEDAPESEVDFLAEVDRILAEADEEVAVDDTEVAVGGEENIDVDTTIEVDPNVKAVQDALTQAQAAAQKLGDPKLTDQIGNTITFFTRAHVVDKGAVAEADEMEEGKKEYYKDAEADDAEHIKALEKDMKYDKQSSLKETLLLQKRAGILTESQYREKMKEAEESVSQDTIQKAEKEAEKIANSSKFDAEMEKIWAKMSDEDKKNLQQGLKSAGILNESLSEGISFDAVLDKAEDVASTLEEGDGDTAAKIGKVVGMIGKINATALGVPGALIAIAAGAPALAAIGVTAAGILAGAALWWLGNKLSDGAVDRAF